MRLTANPYEEPRNRLVEENLGLVRAAVRSLSPRSQDLADELFQVGSLALVESAARFDPSRGNRFSSFAYPWIRGRMLSFLRSKRRGFPAEIVSLESQLTDAEGDAQNLHDITPDTKAENPETAAFQRIEAERVRQCLGVLTERQRKVVRMRFGIDCEPRSVAEIAAVLGVSRQSVNETLNGALRRLRLKLGGIAAERPTRTYTGRAADEDIA
jgi:RNA polymerase sigma-B factor